MSVYVDPLINWGGSATFRWKDSCHLFADTVEELHLFAKSIGMKRAWFQLSKSGNFPHYDLNESRRKVAVRRGAKELTLREAAEMWRRKGWMRR